MVFIGYMDLQESRGIKKIEEFRRDFPPKGGIF
jgi:hypothetical protein